MQESVFGRVTHLFFHITRSFTTFVVFSVVIPGSLLPITITGSEWACQL